MPRLKLGGPVEGAIHFCQGIAVREFASEASLQQGNGDDQALAHARVVVREAPCGPLVRPQ